MKTIFAAAAAAVALVVTPVVAADAPMMMVDEQAMSYATSNWDGVYAGVQGGYDLDGYGVVQGVLGANFTATDSILLGVEGAFGPYIDGGGIDGFEGYVAGRAGFLADPALIYLIGGMSLVDGDVDWLAGAGAEFMVTDSVSLRGQVLNYGGDFMQVTGGVLWHFN